MCKNILRARTLDVEVKVPHQDERETTKDFSHTNPYLYGNGSMAARFFALTLTLVFVIEFFIMAVMNVYFPLPTLAHSLLDAFLLVFLLFPALYFFILRPLSLQIRDERRQADKMFSDLKESEERFSRIAEHSPDIILRWNPVTGMEYANPALEKITGYAPEEVLGNMGFLASKLHTEDMSAFIETMQSIGAKGETVKAAEFRMFAKDGSIIWLDARFVPLWDENGELVAAEVVARTITGKKNGEELLRKQTEQLSVVSDALKNYLDTGNLKEASACLLQNTLKQTQSAYGCIGFLTNDNVLRILVHEGVQWDAKENLGFYENAVKTYQDVGYLEFHNFKSLFGTALTSGEAVISNEPKKDARFGGLPPGHPALDAFLGVPIKKGADVVGMIGLANKPGGYTGQDSDDISIIAQAAGILFNDHRRWENETALENERKKVANKMARLFSAVEQTADVIMITNKDGMIEYVNASFESLTVYRKDEVAGKTPAILKSGKHDRLFYENFWNTILSGKVYRGEFINRKKNGELYTSYKTVTPIRDEDGKITHFVGVDKDVTEKKHEEENLEKMARLESLGVLAGGIAHDFNNILTAILGNVSFAKLTLNAQSKTYDLLDEAEKASLRAKDLARQLLTFSKGGEPIKVVTSVVSLVQDAAHFAARGANVRCAFSIPEDLWLCEVDEGQISQVIQNIVLNAEQAMPDGGKIMIGGENVVVEENDTLPLKSGNYVRLSIQDEGIGIPKECLDRIFEPYFTTKKEGSGLGLATTYSIIKKHNGHIVVDSQPGYGTTFAIYFPACAQYTRVPQSATNAHLVAGGYGKILVMDDEASIRTLLEEMLEFLGYEAVFAADGAQAVDVFKKTKEENAAFDAVILDLTIPGGMGGKDAVKLLLEIDPKVKAIVSSGYSDNPVMADYKNHGFTAVMEKPYDMEKFGEVLKSVIGKNSKMSRGARKDNGNK